MSQPEVAMAKAVVLHWDEVRTAWAVLSWHDWVRFRGMAPGENTLLAGAEAGEHYFLVCVLGDDGELHHAIPHPLHDVCGRTSRVRLRRARGGGARGVIAHRGGRHADPP